MPTVCSCLISVFIGRRQVAVLGPKWVGSCKLLHLVSWGSGSQGCAVACAQCCSKRTLHGEDKFLSNRFFLLIGCIQHQKQLLLQCVISCVCSVASGAAMPGRPWAAVSLPVRVITTSCVLVPAIASFRPIRRSTVTNTMISSATRFSVWAKKKQFLFLFIPVLHAQVLRI